MRATILGAVMLATGGIFGSVLLLRRPVREAEASRSVRERQPSTCVREEPVRREELRSSALPPPRPAGSGRSTPTPAGRVPVEEFWEGLGALLETRSSADPDRYRQELMSRTAEYLGLDPSRAVVFQSVAVQTLSAIRGAWKAREEEVLSLPTFLEDEERDRREQEIQDRYEAAKRQASDRLESLLGTTAHHEQFRRKLGEWIDAVR